MNSEKVKYYQIALQAFENGKNIVMCPFTKGKLNLYNDMMYSPKAGVGYPKINDFIFLNKNDAVFIGERE
tara:strand:+ start:5336 stop:5545 length:210 start_codon:yes stop_codon:yes gene_type:complete